MKGIYPLKDRRFHPWKNGGGETAEILVSPPGSGFDDFDWRISTAVVASDGPFSTFSGIDRVLTIVDGGPVLLSINEESHLLDAASPPLFFSGDAACMAELRGERLLDFNVMLRRPLRAVVRRGVLDPRLTKARRNLALLLELRAGLSRLDLIDLDVADAGLVAALTGAEVIYVGIFE